MSKIYYKLHYLLFFYFSTVFGSITADPYNLYRRPVNVYKPIEQVIFSFKGKPILFISDLYGLGEHASRTDKKLEDLVFDLIFSKLLFFLSISFLEEMGINWEETWEKIEKDCSKTSSSFQKEQFVITYFLQNFKNFNSSSVPKKVLLWAEDKKIAPRYDIYLYSVDLTSRKAKKKFINSYEEWKRLLVNIQEDKSIRNISSYKVGNYKVHVYPALFRGNKRLKKEEIEPLKWSCLKSIYIGGEKIRGKKFYFYVMKQREIVDYCDLENAYTDMRIKKKLLFLLRPYFKKIVCNTTEHKILLRNILEKSKKYYK